MTKSLIDPDDMPQQGYEQENLDAHLPVDSVDAVTKQRLEREIQACSMRIKPRFMAAIRSVCYGATYRSAANKYHIHPTTLSRTLKSPDGLRLQKAISRLKSLIDGTNYLQRESMLWRIAASNEECDPRTAIAAIAEINRTKNDTPDALQKQKDNSTISSAPTIVIQLADARLLPSPLDNIKDLN